MKIKSFAKINLTLNVGKKLNSGLHNIQTNSILIDLHDQIEMKKNKKKKDKIIFKGPFSKAVKKNNNTILDTLKILRNSKKVVNYYDIEVKKNIPVFSGLGGGTSNSYFVLKKIFKNKKIDKKILKNIEKKIGSDIKLFHFKQAFQKNLNTIINYKKNFNLYLLLIYPYINCSTKRTYSKVKKVSKFSRLNYSNFKKIDKFLKDVSSDKNDLQEIVENEYPEVTKILKNLQHQKGCCFSRMTGSGSVCYGIFQNKRLTYLAAKNLNKIFPNYWHAITKTI